MTIPQEPRAVVTGGAGGLGRALCLSLAQRGAKVVIADRDLAGAEGTAQEVSRQGGVAYVTRCDVSRVQEIEALASFAEQQLGGVDVVVNNAGVAVSGPVGDVPIADWEWIVSINLMGVIYGCHVFAPRLRAQRSGHILNVASAAGLFSAPEMAPYCVTKAGVVALSESLAAELQDHGVGVSVLCPTFFKTNIMSNSRSGTLTAGLDQVVEARMQRSKLQADDVARLALEACDRDQLYVVPMQDGQWLWRLKRLAPERFVTSAPRAMKLLRGRATRKQRA